MNHPSASARQESTPADRNPLRHDAATRRACSVFAVSHRLDGFLLLPLHGLVASRSQPWGSSGCGSAASPPLEPVPMRDPPEPSPPDQLSPRHRGDMPPCPCPTCVRSRGTSRLSSGRESVVTPPRERGDAPDALLGFPLWSPDGPEGPTVIPLPVAEAPSRRRNPRGPRSPDTPRPSRRSWGYRPQQGAPASLPTRRRRFGCGCSRTPWVDHRPCRAWGRT